MKSLHLSLICKMLTIAILCLLMFGYLAVNLWDFSSLAITLIRLCAFSGILALATISLPTKMKLSTPLLAISMIALIGVPTSEFSLGILFICMTIFATQKVSYEYIVSSSAWVLGIALIMSIMLVQLGIVTNMVDVTGATLELGGELRARSTYGYKNVNAFSAIVGNFCLLFMMAGRRIIIRCAIALILSFLIYLDTNTRSMMTTSVFFVIFSVIFFLARTHPFFLKLFAGIILITPVLVTILASFVMSVDPFLDNLLSGRLSFISMYFSEIPFYRFIIGGAEPSIAITVDNAFALVAGAIGVPLLIYITHITYQRVLRCVNEADFRTYSFLLCFWLYSFVESSMVRPETIICIVFWILVMRQNSAIDKGRFSL